MAWRRKFGLSEFWRLCQNVGPVFILEDLRWDGDRRSKKTEDERKSTERNKYRNSQSCFTAKNPAVKLVGSCKARSKFKIFFVADWSLIQPHYKISSQWYNMKLFLRPLCCELQTPFCANLWVTASCVQATVKSILISHFLYFVTTAWLGTNTSGIRWVCAPRDLAAQSFVCMSSGPVTA